MENQFIVGVADVRLYDGDDNLIAVSKTMLNTSMEISTGSTEISGGKRNKLLNVYYHSGRLNLTLEDTVFNMEWIKYNVGGELTEAVVPYNIATTSNLVAGANSLPSGAKNPVAFNGSDVAKIYVGQNAYDYDANAGTFTVPETDENIGKKVCLEYYVYDASAESYTIPAAIMPQRVRAILSVDIAANRQGEGVIGQFVIEIPVLQLSGAQTINMTSDGYSTTPLSGMALAYTPVANDTDPCQNKDIYAITTKQIYGANWYDNVVGLAVIGGNVSLEQGASENIEIVAITKDGQTKAVVWEGLTITIPSGSGLTLPNTGANTGKLSAAVDATAGDYVIAIAITGKPSVTTDFTVTVTESQE